MIDGDTSGVAIKWSRRGKASGGKQGGEGHGDGAPPEPEESPAGGTEEPKEGGTCRVVVFDFPLSFPLDITLWEVKWEACGKCSSSLDSRPRRCCR